MGVSSVLVKSERWVTRGMAVAFVRATLTFLIATPLIFLAAVLLARLFFSPSLTLALDLLMATVDKMLWTQGMGMASAVLPFWLRVGLTVHTVAVLTFLVASRVLIGKGLSSEDEARTKSGLAFAGAFWIALVAPLWLPLIKLVDLAIHALRGIILNFEQFYRIGMDTGSGLDPYVLLVLAVVGLLLFLAWVLNLALLPVEVISAWRSFRKNPAPNNLFSNGVEVYKFGKYEGDAEGVAGVVRANRDHLDQAQTTNADRVFSFNLRVLRRHDEVMAVALHDDDLRLVEVFSVLDDSQITNYEILFQDSVTWQLMYRNEAVAVMPMSEMMRERFRGLGWVDHGVMGGKTQLTMPSKISL